MNNRSFLGGLLAVLLVGLLCVCGLGVFFFTGGNAATAFLTPFQSGSGAAPQPLVEPLSGAESAPEETVVETAREPIEIPSDALAVLQAEEAVLTTLYDTVSPSVVNIGVGGGTGGMGSGFVWDKEGHIVTNNHVVEAGGAIIVTFPDNVQLDAEIVGTDPNSDLAVIRVETDPDLLHPVALNEGQRVIAIGNPFGLDGTMTAGIVSAVGRVASNQIATASGDFSLPNLIQTDAPINPGNSGGPLLDIQGRVVGVNTLIYSQTGSNSGVGFAVPVDKVKAVVPAIIEQGFYETPYLGIVSLGTGLNQELAETLQLENVTYGLLVQEVAPGGPSDEAGVQGGDREIEIPGAVQAITTGGDVIIAIDEQTVRDFDDLINYLDTRAVGDIVTLTVIRDGEQVEIPVTLGARP
jgi:S1-C subfamily serine protease